MITLHHIASGLKIDVDTKVTYIKRSADMGDVTKVASSYSHGVKVPKTPTNAAFMKGLGLVGNISDVPYKRQVINLLDDGIMIVREGYLGVTQTASGYKVKITEGMVDWYSTIKSDKVSEVIDLSDLDHVNSVANIIASFTGPLTYRYIIAGYNGPPLPNHVSGTTDLNPFSLVPSINLKYLFDKLFAYYGWTYTGSFDISSSWMTYPNGVKYDNAAPIVAVNYNQDTDIFPWVASGDAVNFTFENKTIDTLYATDSPPGVRIAQTGVYRITMFARGRMRYLFGYDSFFIQIVRNGVIMVSEITDNEAQEGTATIDLICQEGDLIWTRAFPIAPTNIQLFYYEGQFDITTLGLVDIDFSEALIKFKVAEFFKDILIRNAIYPFPDARNKVMHFLSMDERIGAEVIDWTRYFVERVSEDYVYKSYAKKNNFTHKYDVSGDDYFDGALYVDNENLKEEKTAYKSPTYAPLEELQEYKDTAFSWFVNNFKMFDIQLKEDPDTGDVLADYKALKNRFYIFKAVSSTRSIYILGTLATNVPIAELSGNTFSDIIPEKFGGAAQVLDRSKIHKIRLNLSRGQVLNLDQTKRYYFKQEQAVYIFDNLKYISGSLPVGEFIKLKL